MIVTILIIVILALIALYLVRRVVRRRSEPCR